MDSPGTGRSELIRRLGLEPFVLELEIDGLTVVPPEVHGVPLAAFDAMADWLLEASEGIVGCRFTLEGGPEAEVEVPDGATRLGERGGENTQFLLPQLTRSHRMFRDLAVNPVAVALARYMIGPRETRFSSHNAFIKWRGEYGYGPNLGLHADQGGSPQPWGRTALSANSNWTLTDYTLEAGPLAFVRGSHRSVSQPLQPGATRRAEPVICPKGSLIMFHGATWHGAFPRTAPGMRLMVANYYRHMMTLPQEEFRNGFPREMAEDCADPATFAALCGFADEFPYVRAERPFPRVRNAAPAPAPAAR